MRKKRHEGNFFSPREVEEVEDKPREGRGGRGLGSRTGRGQVEEVEGMKKFQFLAKKSGFRLKK